MSSKALVVMVFQSLTVSTLTDCAVLCCRYGFVVYSDPNVVDVACAGLNGLKMGDRTLTVRRAAEVRHI